MRVISQDGTLDVPYEMVVVKRFGNAVYFLNRNLAGVENQVRDIELAEYSTEEKAKKAMKMLRKAYVGSIVMFKNVEPTDELKEMLKIHGIEAVYAILDNQPQEIKFENHQNFYFQFPAEEELE